MTLFVTLGVIAHAYTNRKGEERKEDRSNGGLYLFIQFLSTTYLNPIDSSLDNGTCDPKYYIFCTMFQAIV